MNAAGVIYEVLAIVLAANAAFTASSGDSLSASITLAVVALVAATLAVAHMLRGLVAVQTVTRAAE